MMTAHSKELNNKELDTDHLRRLSGEAARLAVALSKLSANPELGADELTPEVDGGPMPDVPVERVTAVIRARRLRARHFDEALFADPAWDMMLDLFEAEISGHRVAVSSLCTAAAVPPTTALRWIKTMVQQGLFIRRNDPFDGRRVYVELAPQASLAMRRYFARIGNVSVV